MRQDCSSSDPGFFYLSDLSDQLLASSERYGVQRTWVLQVTKMIFPSNLTATKTHACW